MGILTYKDTQFYLDGKPYTVVSGAIHYFRVPDKYWYDRLLKLKECGFNTVETYTCWNLHEPREGEFDFSGMLDIVKFIETATEVGLNIILRPGPFICAEWEAGGLPSWLLKYKDVEFRCMNERYISAVRNFYNVLLPLVRPYMAVNGGNIFMLQIENEYGSHGNDKEYLREIVKIYKENDIDCLFFTSDGPGNVWLSGGTLDEYLAVANFGSRPKEQLQDLLAFRTGQPLMCGEFWGGWFDHWGDEHHENPPAEVAGWIDDFFDMGASFNLYMFHGGTNFGFLNGANGSTFDKDYAPTITSYDYAAPLSEAGDRTPLYYSLRSVMEKRLGSVPPLTAKETPKASYGEVNLTERADLFENLENISAPHYSSLPKYMEDLGQDYGYTLYRTTFKGPREQNPRWELAIDTVHDRAQIFMDKEHRLTLERWNMPENNKTGIFIPLERGETCEMDILVENMGRINHSNVINDPKGIKGVRCGYQQQMGWNMYPLDMRNLDGLKFKECDVNEKIKHPTFFKGTLNIEDTPCDTFVELPGFTKGFVKINGINIGRYFNTMGPQKTLYVPAPFLKSGENEIIVFETDEVNNAVIRFFDKPVLG